MFVLLLLCPLLVLRTLLVGEVLPEEELPSVNDIATGVVSSTLHAALVAIAGIDEFWASRSSSEPICRRGLKIKLLVNVHNGPQWS